MDVFDAVRINELLAALGERLALARERAELVVIGGSVLTLLGLVESRHEQDLRALEPTRDELVTAARWTITQDPSAGYREVLERALAYLGVEDADLDA